MQPHYPFAFVQCEALQYVKAHGHEFDVIHASPPCQRWARGYNPYRLSYPDLLHPLRELIQTFAQTRYVLENVPGAPLLHPVWICGGGLGCANARFQLHRHRGFESNVPLKGVACCKIRPLTLTVTGSGTPTGTWQKVGSVSLKEKQDVMGISWMTHRELAQALPPAYTKWIGTQLRLAHVPTA